MPEIRLPADSPTPPLGVSLLALGFRPFFLGAGILAALSLAVWLAVLWGYLTPQSYFAGTTWHAHEMLFGYVGAVVAGFLLTAVRNWTGMDTPSGTPLAMLALIWLAARVAPWLPLPPALIALPDIAFFPLVLIGLWRPLWLGPNKANRVFIALLAGMTVASLLVHMDAAGLAPGAAVRGDRMMLDLALITLLIVGGRVMPFFTERGLGGAKSVTRPWVEQSTFVLAPALLAADLWRPGGWAAASLAIALGLIQLVRLSGWYYRGVLKVPMLAVLYAGYTWLVAGLLLDGLAGFGLLPPPAALHALTTGALGVFTLGMMARVTLGHTGRLMEASRLTMMAFVLVNLAAVLRAPMPLVFPGAYREWLVAAGICWVLAFGLFVWVYGPMLVRPRVDGRPG